MIKAIIIDDEVHCVDTLSILLDDFCPEVEVMEKCMSAKKGLEAIERHKPELVFLDIEMPIMNGFELLEQFKQIPFSVVFTTSYDQYAIKAIRFAAFDYLLKPVDIEELKAAVAKIQDVKQTQVKKQVELLRQNMQQPQLQLHKLAIPALEGLFFYDINEVVHLEANSNYTNIYFSNKTKIVASKTLKEFEELLPEEFFFRTHHSHIINLNYIKRYIKGDGGQIEMQNGNYVDVSRRKKDEFLKIIGL